MFPYWFLINTCLNHVVFLLFFQIPKKEKGPAPRPPSIVSPPQPSTPEREKGPAPLPPISVNASSKVPPISPLPTKQPPLLDNNVAPSSNLKQISPPPHKSKSDQVPTSVTQPNKHEATKHHKDDKKVSGKTGDIVKNPAPKPPKVNNLKESPQMPNNITASGQDDKKQQIITKAESKEEQVPSEQTTPLAPEQKAKIINNDSLSNVSDEPFHTPPSQRHSHPDALSSKEAGQQIVDQVCGEAEKIVEERQAAKADQLVRYVTSLC